ncbi:MAG: MBL fold metallo-hydrolase [Armatimonadetes bacterium]|nr:MBL fold metallo-hydrolase [Armatimonadota bacterium]
MNRITFLGTGGARVLVFKQLLASGGLWIEQADTRISLDPGPGALVQATKRKLDPTKLDAILLSHRHLDHSGDINAMIEAMTTGGFNQRGLVLAPRDAYEDDPVILHYLRGYVRDLLTIEEGATYQIGGVTVRTPVRHHHPGEVYGFVFESPGCRWSYLADTRYFPELADHYRADVVVMHTVRLEESDIPHLSIPDAKRLIEAIRPQTAILTHFGMTVWRAKPWEVAERLTQETGVEVKAARDGMRFDLPGPDAPSPL